MYTLIYKKFQTNDTKEVLQFHYTNWPDFGVPASPGDFLNFLIAVRESGALDISDEVGPPVIHCSAGIGRSGTFILVDTCLVLVSINIDCMYYRRLKELVGSVKILVVEEYVITLDRLIGYFPRYCLNTLCILFEKEHFIMVLKVDFFRKFI